MPCRSQLSTVQFHLLISSIMMLSREGFRRGCLRFQPEKVPYMLYPSTLAIKLQRFKHIMSMHAAGWLCGPLASAVGVLAGLAAWRRRHRSCVQHLPGDT
jgi:hypothetical protein